MLLFFKVHDVAVGYFLYWNVQETGKRIFYKFLSELAKICTKSCDILINTKCTQEIGYCSLFDSFLCLVLTSIFRLVFTKMLFPFYSLKFLLQLWQVQVQEDVTVI